MSSSEPPDGFGDRHKSIGNGPAADDTRQITFSPTEKQEQFMFDTSPQICMSGTVGAGKSKIGCEKGYYLNTQYPGNRGLIVRKAFFDVRSSTINQTLLEDVIPDSHIVDHNKGEHVIEHLTGQRGPEGEPITSEIHYHGLDSGRTSSDNLPKKIMSHEFGWIFVDEGTETDEGEWSGLLTRLRYDGKRHKGVYYPVPVQQIFTATNPAPPTHWMYGQFFRDGGDDGTSTYRMSLHDNPGVSKAYRQRMETQLSGIHYERLVEGKWKGAQGMIYNEYDPLEHLLHPDDLPGDWTIMRESEWAATGEKSYWVLPPGDWQIYRGIDFGYTNPFVCQWWAQSPDDTLVLFRELYRSKRRYQEQAEDIKRMTPDSRRILKSYADHDAEGNETLNRHGVSTVNAEKSVSDGIQSVKRRLKLDDRGRAGLYFMEGARVHKPDPDRVLDEQTLKTTDEISGYVWDEDATEKGKDEPKKEDDHGCFVAGTQVTTLAGDKAIENITPGDMVLTRSGYYPVVAAGKTGENVPVEQVELADGRELVGTSDHPIHTETNGFACLGSLGYGTYLTDRTDNPAWSNESSSTASSSDGTQTPITGQTGTTTDRTGVTSKTALNHFTERCISRLTALFPTATTSTTSMETPRTTTPTTSKLSHRTNISMDTSSRGVRRRFTAPSRSSRLGSGTSLKKAKSGTVSTGKSRLLRSSSRSNASVFSAGTRSPIEALTARESSARTLVSKLTGAIQAWTTLFGSVPSVVTSTRRTSTSQRKPAAVVAERSSAGRTADVYNLKVAGPSEYYANGVLVHNCDAMRYVVYSLDGGINISAEERAKWMEVTEGF